MRARGLDDSDVVEIRQFCRDLADKDLLQLHGFGLNALALVRAWSGTHEEIVGNWVGEGSMGDHPLHAPAESSAPEPLPVMAWLPHLRLLRERAGFSVHELAREVGVAVGIVARIERLAQRANPTTVHRLAQALGVDPARLVAGPDR